MLSIYIICTVIYNCFVFVISIDENWANALFSLSPTGELLAICYGTKFAILGSTWDNDIQQNKYCVTWKMDLTANNKITAIICLPIVAMGKSSTQVMPEWTCIMIGLESGFVNAYTDCGFELFSQQFHTEPVQMIKTQCQAYVKHKEEIHVQYQSCIYMLLGSHFFPHIRELKKVRNTSIHEQISVQRCKLMYDVDDITTTNDAVIVDIPMLCKFDHLLANRYV